MARIAQIAITVRDVDRSVGFYRDIIGLTFLFSAGPNLAFLDADGLRIMLTTPQGGGAIGENSVLYFDVPDADAAYRTAVERGAEGAQESGLTARLERSEIWIAFLRDPDGNLVGLMEERAI